MAVVRTRRASDVAINRPRLVGVEGARPEAVYCSHSSEGCVVKFVEDRGGRGPISGCVPTYSVSWGDCISSLKFSVSCS